MITTTKIKSFKLSFSSIIATPTRNQQNNYVPNDKDYNVDATIRSHQRLWRILRVAAFGCFIMVDITAPISVVDQRWTTIAKLWSQCFDYLQKLFLISYDNDHIYGDITYVPLLTNYCNCIWFQINHLKDYFVFIQLSVTYVTICQLKH
jgi:hypothetical protein